MKTLNVSCGRLTIFPVQLIWEERDRTRTLHFNLYLLRVNTYNYMRQCQNYVQHKPPVICEVVFIHLFLCFVCLLYYLFIYLFDWRFKACSRVITSILWWEVTTRRKHKTTLRRLADVPTYGQKSIK